MDNTRGHKIDLPRTPVANDPTFAVYRELDGHIATREEDSLIDKSNPHVV